MHGPHVSQNHICLKVGESAEIFLGVFPCLFGMIEGVVFNQIELDVNMDGKVFYVGFFNSVDSDELLMDYCAYFKEILDDFMGDPDMEYPLDDDNTMIEFYDYYVDGQVYVAIGAYYSGLGFSSLWLTYSDDSLR